MKTHIAAKAAYLGAGAGLVLFFIVCLTPVSLMGGEAGMAFAGAVTSLPKDPGFTARAIVLATMILTVLVSGIAVVGSSTALAWIIGSVVDSGVQKRLEKPAH